VGRMLFLSASVLGLALSSWGVYAEDSKVKPASAPAAAAPTGKHEGTCGGYGTAVEFFGTPSEAAKKARQDQKLVFVLHVSGHFEDPRFT